MVTIIAMNIVAFPGTIFRLSGLVIITWFNDTGIPPKILLLLLMRLQSFESEDILKSVTRKSLKKEIRSGCLI